MTRGEPSLLRRLRLRTGAGVRGVPGGSSLLRLRRRGVAAARSRVRPLRPPLETPARAARLSETSEDESFITGNGIAARCRYVLNYDVLRTNEEVDNDWWFCKAEFLEYFFRELAPREEFVLFSHNSARAIGRRFRPLLRRPSLVAWFAKNPVLEHPKLRALPLGIANPAWPHGDQAELRRVRASRPAKSALFDVSFSVGTNDAVRRYCLEQTGLAPAPRRPFGEYLEALAAARFCISPSGRGIDSHRTWEALYVGTVPVVTRSLLTDQHPDLPMVVLEDWSQFRSIEFTPELYDELWRGFDPDALRLDRYLERVEAELRRLRG